MKYHVTFKLESVTEDLDVFGNGSMIIHPVKVGPCHDVSFYMDNTQELAEFAARMVRAGALSLVIERCDWTESEKRRMKAEQYWPPAYDIFTPPVAPTRLKFGTLPQTAARNVTTEWGPPVWPPSEAE